MNCYLLFKHAICLMYLLTCTLLFDFRLINKDMDNGPL